MNHLSDRRGVAPAAARPFVKWVGGKRQLLPHLLPLLATTEPSATYHEPFVGGGAAFFGLRSGGWARRSRLSDLNDELIHGYQAVRDHVDDVLSCLRRHARLNSEEYFYRVRAKRPDKPPEIAARLIYLNKTCFNGLYRVNKSGGFNSPWGRYENPTICDESNLRAVSAALETAQLEAASFQTVLSAVRTGDVVYFDPPYVPRTRTANFTGYSAAGFDSGAQRALASVFRELDKGGVRVVLSNSDVGSVHELYAGFRIQGVLARRNVNNRGDQRGPVGEVIVCNF